MRLYKIIPIKAKFLYKNQILKFHNYQLKLFYKYFLFNYI